MIIHLTDNDNVTNAFILTRQDMDDSVVWNNRDEQFSIEIITDKEIKKIKKIIKSDTITESQEEIQRRFSDSVFENKMTQLI